MGERQNRPFQLSFNSSLKVDFQGARVTSDGGLILVSELDDRLGLSVPIERHLSDPAPRQERAVTIARFAAAVGVQPTGRLCGRERR